MEEDPIQNMGLFQNHSVWRQPLIISLDSVEI